MGRDSFGSLFKITTFGESHGKGIGVVIDGCPAGISIEREEIQRELDKRRPGVLVHTSKRQEEDQVEILSGIFEGKTLGSPIALLIYNKDSDSSKYHPIKDLYRPGHANFTYLEKYGVFDYRGGGRASGRETAARVAAGAIAKKYIAPMEAIAKISEIGGESDPLKWEALLQEVEKEGDSLGGIISCTITRVPVGLGDPVYEKLSAKLAYGMLSIPAVKGIEFGLGFQAATKRGSFTNDPFIQDESGKVSFSTNHHGGILGGISSGMPITFRVAFKPTSSIKKPIDTLDREGNKKAFLLPEGSRHDPCIALRAPPVIESMAALVLADAYLLNRSGKI
jgi:chorismate synthase